MHFGYNLLILERIGQAGVFVTPLFYSVELETFMSKVALLVMALFLALYYSGWWRYFNNRKSYISLYQPMGKIPIPLAITPVGYLLGAAILLQSLPLFIFNICLAAGHWPISYAEYRRIQERKCHF